MAQIKLKNLTKRWGDFVAVENFDLDIPDEEFLVLLGPSGCGKTTTMRMIAGLEEITSGDVEIDGKVVNNLEPKDRDIAMVFQSYGLYPNMNVYENIRFPLKVRNVDPATHDERVRRAAAMVELDDFLHRRPAALSGGQRQRVALARACGGAVPVGGTPDTATTHTCARDPREKKTNKNEVIHAHTRGPSSPSRLLLHNCALPWT